MGRNADLVKSLGAAAVIDYTETDVTKGEARYDLVFDAVGAGSPGSFKRIPAEGGSFVSVRSSTTESPSELIEIRDLLAAGRIRAIIDGHYSLEQIREAHSYVEKGRKAGNVLILVRDR